MKANTYPEIDAIDLKTVSPQEFQRLCRKFIIGVAHRTGLDFGECEDVFQGIMEKVFIRNAFKNFDPARRLTAYLATIVKRDAYERITVLAKVSAMEPNTLEQVCDAEYSTESSIEKKEQTEFARDIIHKGLEVLRRRIRNPKQVDALIMREIEGKNTEETARLLGESVHYVHLACHRCRERLAEIISKLMREEEGRKFCA